MNEDDAILESREEDAPLREKLRAMLADGLETDWENRAYDTEEVDEVISRLQELSPDDYDQKLIIAGFLDHPYSVEGKISQECETCIHFAKHREHCDVPELDLPVEPEWSCVLWRI